MRKQSSGSWYASTTWRRAWGTLPAALGLLLAAGTSVFGEDAVVRGRTTFDTFRATLQGLQLSQPLRGPAIGVTMQVTARNASNPSAPIQVLGRAVTNEAGDYAIRLPITAPITVSVWVLAQAENARVVHATSGALYAYSAPEFTLSPGDSVTQDLALVDNGRSSGPFSILDTIRRCNALVRSALPGTVVPPITVRWATDYRGGTFYNRSTRTLFLNGDRAINSDEFDPSVIGHEYGHHIHDLFGRNDSRGGTHGLGEMIDPRQALSEGWATFFGQASLNEPNYIDTVGLNSSMAWGFSVEENLPSWEKPGYWSEATVYSVLWDLFDTQFDSGDEVALGFPPIFRAFTTGLLGERERYLIDFCDTLVQDYVWDASVTSGLVAILRERSITYRPGMSPSVPNPFPAPLTSNATVIGSVDSTAPASRPNRWNLWTASASFTFTLASTRPVELRLQIVSSRTASNADLDLLVWNDQDQLVALSARTNGVGGEERIATNLPAGTYLVEVVSWYAGSTGFVYNSGDYALTALF